MTTRISTRGAKNEGLILEFGDSPAKAPKPGSSPRNVMREVRILLKSNPYRTDPVPRSRNERVGYRDPDNRPWRNI